MAAGATVAAGLGVHFLAGGSAWEVVQNASGPVGDALYAALAYVAVAFVGVRARHLMVAALSFGVCAAVELFQLTGVPERLQAAFAPVALVLGSTFSPWDLLAYAVGVGCAASADHLFACRMGGRSRGRSGGQRRAQS